MGMAELKNLIDELNELSCAFPDKLRKSVLQSAVEGKLVPQDPKDEPASILVERIAEARKALVKAGKIKRDKHESVIFRGSDRLTYETRNGETVCIEDELPFKIPESWAWVRFGSIVKTWTGKTPPRCDAIWWGSDVPWVSIADMKDGATISSTREGVTNAAVDKTFGHHISPIGTLIMSFKLTIGKVSILGVPAVHNEAIISIFPYYDTANILRNYLFLVLPLIAPLGKAKDAIMGNTLNSSSLADLMVPLPPLAEQKRIVAQIETMLKVSAALTT